MLTGTPGGVPPLPYRILTIPSGIFSPNSSPPPQQGARLTCTHKDGQSPTWCAFWRVGQNNGLSRPWR
jgi:hypothetical protein